MPLSAKARRRKGHDWEREFAREARDTYRIPAKRNPQYRGESDGSDVVLFENTPLQIEVECKCRQSFSSADICRLVNEGRHVAVKIDRVGSFVALDLDDYFDLLVTKASE